MNIEIVEHKHPKLKIPECVCDKELHTILNNYELLKIAFNKLSSATLIIGKPGQGKTTFVQSLFSNKNGLRGKYSKIYLFCPPRSRESMLDGALNQLDEEIEDKSEQSHYFIKLDTINVDEFIDNFQKLKFNTDNTVGPKSISKNEFIKEINTFMM